MCRFAFLALVAATLISGCGNKKTTPPPHDSGPPSTFDAAAGPHDGGVHRDGCTPTFEVCGDHVDQNCDGRDESCGDMDRDGVQACRPTDDLSYPLHCDCDDSNAMVYPPVGTVPGAPEACDGMDNNCDGRIDEASACCVGCMALAPHQDRADMCDTTGACVCSTQAPGNTPCPEGQTCCSGGCVDVTNDVHNCGFCGAACTVQSDHCEARQCRCGTTAPCDFTTACTSGGC